MNGEEAQDEEVWSGNYFNYFTEIEEHFRTARGTSLFLLSPLDWALIESWKSTGVPLEAVVKGIDEAFEKWRGRKVKSQRVNSIAYCAQAVMDAAKRLSGAGAARARGKVEAPFQTGELQQYLRGAAKQLQSSGREAYHAVAITLEALAADAETHCKDLEDLERRLTSLEEKMVAVARSASTDDALLDIRRRLDAELSPYRGKMSVEQLTMLERRYLDTSLLERENLPRLSLFYLHQ